MSMIRPRVLFVTRSRYWHAGNGEATRTRTLIEALAGVCQLTVFFLGAADADTSAAVAASPYRYRLAHGSSEKPAREALLAAARQLCGQTRPDVVLLSRLQLDFLRQAVPPGTRLVIDTLDLVSDNAASRRQAGVAVEEPLDFEREIAFLRRYDRVLLIQPDDHARVAARLGERALCVPHPVELPAQPVRPGSRVLGCAASQSPANRHGLQWFFGQVWPQLATHRIELQLAGPLSALLPQPLPAGVRACGVVPTPDALWAGVDVAINPVRWGSGLKIKTVEALASGLPLVTTREGARGLEHLADQAFLLADDPAAFGGACLHLLDDADARRTLSATAQRWAGANLSTEACFGPFFSWLSGIS
jgi:hypothetical protein